jgi:hypothetical protein
MHPRRFTHFSGQFKVYAGGLISVKKVTLDMHKIGFTLEKTFFDNLLQRLEEQRQQLNEMHRRSNRSLPFILRRQSWLQDDFYSSSTLPSAKHLASLVETSFWASLKKEEGRSLTFSLAYAPASDAIWKPQKFDTSLPFDVETITKLAPVACSHHLSIAVGQSTTGDLEINGLFTSSPPLVIKVLDPGNLIVSYVNGNVAVISGEEAVFVRDPLIIHRASIWSIFRPQDENGTYSTFSDPKVDAIKETLCEMRRLGHGGALIIVPDNDEWEKSVDLPLKYSNKQPFDFLSETLQFLIEEEKKSGRFSTETYLYRDGLTSSAQALAQLTAVDGATLITPDLKVLGFGVKLNAGPDPSEPNEIYSIYPLDQENWINLTRISGLGGTRHQSAARFILKQREAVALVVSQDGHITSLVWEKMRDINTLVAYKRLEFNLF